MEKQDEMTSDHEEYDLGAIKNVRGPGKGCFSRRNVQYERVSSRNNANKSYRRSSF